MYEYHGWVNVRPTFRGDAVELTEYDRVALELKNKVLPAAWPTGRLTFDRVHGDWHLSLSGYDNHKPVNPYNPADLFRRIAEFAPGSYDLLYVCDDEDKEHSNEFMVYVLSRQRHWWHTHQVSGAPSDEKLHYGGAFGQE